MLTAKCYDARTQSWRCYLWGVGAPFGLAMKNAVMATYIDENIGKTVIHTKSDILIRLQGLILSTLSLGILSLLKLPKKTLVPVFSFAETTMLEDMEELSTWKWFIETHKRGIRQVRDVGNIILFTGILTSGRSPSRSKTHRYISSSPILLLTQHLSTICSTHRPTECPTVFRS